MRYADVRDYVQIGLSAKGYGEKNKPMPVLAPGPSDNLLLQKLTPNAMAFLTLGDGRGFTTELLFDQPFIRVRAIGAGNDFENAETLAYDIDTVLCSVDGNTQIGSVLALYVTRAGGAPALLQQDTADRYHFTCTYITETESGL